MTSQSPSIFHRACHPTASTRGTTSLCPGCLKKDSTPVANHPPSSSMTPNPASTTARRQSSAVHASPPTLGIPEAPL